MMASYSVIFCTYFKGSFFIFIRFKIPTTIAKMGVLPNLLASIFQYSLLRSCRKTLRSTKRY
ncbi:hypothetical protein BJV82DRAFT_630479 [Fennellomyces sp. T-0311]|nr:hypothetical protein BJV82DRAFT_630479 [Fennellomyces sp. T-0311]